MELVTSVVVLVVRSQSSGLLVPKKGIKSVACIGHEKKLESLYSELLVVGRPVCPLGTPCSTLEGQKPIKQA